MDPEDIGGLRAPPVGVRVVPLEERTTSAPLRIEGRFAASRAVQLKAPLSGVLRGLDFSLGDPVENGQVICTIGAAAHKQRALATESQIHLLSAQLEEREDGLAQAEARGDKPERIASMESKVRMARHRLEQERTQLARHRAIAEAVEVRAPFDARVAAVGGASGGSIVTGNLLLELVEIDPAVLVLEVPTWVAARCRVGAPVEVHADADEAARLGKVSRWSPTAQDGVRRLLVDVENPDGRIAAGEGGVALLEVGEREAFFAPRAALHHEKKTVQLQLVEHSRVTIRSVRVLGGDEKAAEVAGALSSSQLVVLHAERPLAESSEVVILGDH